MAHYNFKGYLDALSLDRVLPVSPNQSVHCSAGVLPKFAKQENSAFSNYANCLICTEIHFLCCHIYLLID